MKRKRKRKKELELGHFDAPGESFTTIPRGTHTQYRGIFITKTFEPY